MNANDQVRRDIAKFIGQEPYQGRAGCWLIVILAAFIVISALIGSAVTVLALRGAQGQVQPTVQP